MENDMERDNTTVKKISQNTSVNGKMVSDMVLVFFSLTNKLPTKVNSAKASDMVKVR